MHPTVEPLRSGIRLSASIRRSAETLCVQAETPTARSRQRDRTGGPRPMRIVVVNYAFSEHLDDPHSLLASYRTLTGWSEALARAHHSVAVVQRFHRDARLASNSVEYVFCRDGDQGQPRSRLWPGRMHRAIVQERPDVVHVN